jgi:hypothetical protein
VIELFPSGCHLAKVEAVQRALARGVRHPLPRGLGEAHQTAHCAGQCSGIAGRCHEAGLAVEQRFFDPTYVCRDLRQAAGSSLQEDHRQTLHSR